MMVGIQAAATGVPVLPQCRASTPFLCLWVWPSLPREMHQHPYSATPLITMRWTSNLKKPTESTAVLELSLKWDTSVHQVKGGSITPPGFLTLASFTGIDGTPLSPQENSLWQVLRSETNLVLNQLHHFLIVCSWACHHITLGVLGKDQGKNVGMVLGEASALQSGWSPGWEEPEQEGARRMALIATPGKATRSYGRILSKG